MGDQNEDSRIDLEKLWIRQEQGMGDDIRCSFCGKHISQVGRLLAGPGKVYVCDECIALYREHLEQDETPLYSNGSFSHICPSCGTRAPVSHKYCYNCGLRFDTQASS